MGERRVLGRHAETAQRQAATEWNAGWNEEEHVCLKRLIDSAWCGESRAAGIAH